MSMALRCRSTSQSCGFVAADLATLLHRATRRPCPDDSVHGRAGFGGADCMWESRSMKRPADCTAAVCFAGNAVAAIRPRRPWRQFLLSRFSAEILEEIAEGRVAAVDLGRALFNHAVQRVDGALAGGFRLLLAREAA